MPRTIDPQRHAARSQVIVDAAFTCFARDGYGGATTASICHQAGIGSGTFFHYFPSKVSVLLAILQAGAQDTIEWFAQQEGRRDRYEVIIDWARHTATAATDPRLPGFIRAVGATATDSQVAAALLNDDKAQRSGLRPWVEGAQADGSVRHDLSEPTVTSWVMLILDGYLARLADGHSFSPGAQQPILIETISRFLTPIHDDHRFSSPLPT